MRLASSAVLRSAALLAIVVSLAASTDAASTEPRTPLAAPTSTTPVVDGAATGRLHAAADQERRDAGVETLFSRSAYITNANRIATAAMNGQTVTPPGDDAPIVYVNGTTADYAYDLTIDAAIDQVVAAAHEVLAYQMHTDGGWSVMTKRVATGLVSYGVALVVGWPNPNVSRTSGCSGNGYCWSNGGLNPHLPWTRNTVKWYLSTSNLPAAGESLVKAAIAKVNAVSGVGAHVVYGGRTTATGPSGTRRFVIRFGNDCSSGSALGCTTTSTQGTYRMVFQARTIISLSRYRANPSTTWWTGTLMHEIAHAMGLGHYDSSYGGTYQLMRWASGPDYIKSGDANGLRDVSPAGGVSGKITAKKGTNGVYTFVVLTSNSGFGGIRAIRTQCTSSTGAYQTVGLVSGTWDTRGANHTVGSFDPPNGASRKCRAVVRSKTSSYTTGAVTVTG